MDRKKQRTIYLWSVPRTLSTAFLRAMATVDGCLAIYEPYINAFYKENKNRPDELPCAPSDSYEEIRNNLRHEFPGYDMVFIKEMAKHLAGRLDDHSYIPQDCIHTFLIRHPVKTMTSYTSALLRMYERTIPDEEKRKEAVTEYMTADKIRTEQSYVFLNEVYSIVTNVYKQRPVIIDADDLQENPEGTLRVYCKEVGIQYQESMVHWGQITTEQKDVYRHRLDYVPDVAMPFIGKALNSKEFQQGAPLKVSVEETDEKYKAIVEENIPVYEKLKKMRLKPTEDVIESPLPQQYHLE